MNTTQETLDLLKTSLSKGDDQLAKTVSTATGLVPFDLQAPAKNLYPVNTPLRNRLPRTSGGVGLATNWKVIQSIQGSGFDAMGWVPEGQRTGRMSYTAVPKAASYVTIGEEDQVTFEAINAGKTFEDIQAMATMRVLQKMMLKEENALFFGNASVQLAQPAMPTLSVGGTGGLLPANTYSVIVIALTGEGVRGASVANGVPISLNITGADGQTYSLNGGSSQKSANATIAVGAGNTLFASTPAIVGALGYAWYIGAAGAETLQVVTSINSLTFNTALNGATQGAAGIAATDHSSNPALAFDGLLPTAFKAGSGAYIKQLASGSPGVGTTLTSSGRGSVSEIDQMFQTMWDQFQVSPSILWVNSQQLKDLTAKVLTGASGPLLNFFADPAAGARTIAAGGAIEFYFNPFGMNGGFKVPIMIHPTLPAGTIIGWAENLPMQYQNANVPNVAEVRTRADYYQLDWPLKTRAREFGVYAEEVLAVYAPFALGVITNIAPG